jgi:hypothetical protein
MFVGKARVRIHKTSYEFLTILIGCWVRVRYNESVRACKVNYLQLRHPYIKDVKNIVRSSVNITHGAYKECLNFG